MPSREGRCGMASRESTGIRWWVVALLAAVALAASACGGGTSGTAPSGSEPGASEAQGPKPGGTLTLALPQAPKTLDPAHYSLAVEDSVASMLGASLTTLAPDGKIVGWLAKDWLVSDDGKTITFHLREGVKFPSGKPLTAGDIKATYDRDLDPKVGSPVAKDLLGAVESIEAPDDETLVLHLKAPNGSILLSLATPGYLQPVDPDALAKWGDAEYGQHPSSVGPYILESWSPGQEVVVKRNPDYNWAPPFVHQGPAYFDRIVFKVIPEPASQMAAFDAGELSVLSVPPQSWDKYKNNPDVQFFELLSGSVVYIDMNETEPLFQDVRVRQAINYATDRKAIVDGAYNGHGLPGWGPYHPALIGYDKSLENYYPFDPDKAKSLLQEAGYTYDAQGRLLGKDGKPMVLRLYTISSGQWPTVAQIVQSQLAQIGIETKITSYEYSALVTYLQKGDYDLSLDGYGWIGGDPGDVLKILTGSLNMSHFEDPDIVQRLDQYTASSDQAERLDLIQQVQRRWVENAYWDVLVYPTTGTAVQGNIGGVKLNQAGGYLYYDDAYVIQK